MGTNTIIFSEVRAIKVLQARVVSFEKLSSGLGCMGGKLSDLKPCPRTTIVLGSPARWERWEAAAQCGVESTNFVVTQAAFKTQL